MRQLIVRFLNVAVIAAVLIGYNTVLDKRDKEDQIARLSAELETTQLQKENLQAAAAASNTADTAASEAAEAEGQYVDGTYDGEADGFGGTIAVEVTVEGGPDYRSCHHIRRRRGQCVSVKRGGDHSKDY